MKKLAAISLLALFAFNTFGFYVYVAYAKRRADMDLEARLDQGIYDESDLVTIKIPLNLPYQTSRNDFERVNGEINISGTIYQYVRRKTYNDTLILQCIASRAKTSLQKKATDFFGKVNDVPGNNTNKRTDTFKQLFNYYESIVSYKYFLHLKGKNLFSLFVAASPVHQYLSVDGQPPQFT